MINNKVYEKTLIESIGRLNRITAIFINNPTARSLFAAKDQVRRIINTTLADGKHVKVALSDGATIPIESSSDFDNLLMDKIKLISNVIVS